VKWGNLCYHNDGDNLLAVVLHKVNAHVQVFNGVMLVAEFPSWKVPAKACATSRCGIGSRSTSS